MEQDSDGDTAKPDDEPKTSSGRAERISARFGLQFERMDVWLMVAIVFGLLAMAYEWLRTR